MPIEEQLTQLQQQLKRITDTLTDHTRRLEFVDAGPLHDNMRQLHAQIAAVIGTADHHAAANRDAFGRIQAQIESEIARHDATFTTLIGRIDALSARLTQLEADHAAHLARLAAQPAPPAPPPPYNDQPLIGRIDALEATLRAEIARVAKLPDEAVRLLRRVKATPAPKKGK